MYHGTKVKVLTPDVFPQFFEILAGVIQGDTLPQQEMVSSVETETRRIGICKWEEDWSNANKLLWPYTRNSR